MYLSMGIVEMKTPGNGQVADVADVAMSISLHGGIPIVNLYDAH